jgi:hypothetical protein
MMPDTNTNRSRAKYIWAGLAVIMLILASVAFSGMQAAKKQSKTDAAVAASAKQQQTTAQVGYDKLLKEPYKTYTGPESFGTISFNYPKNWSAYDGGSGSEPINMYFHPDIVPATSSDTAYALRVELLNTDYASVLQGFQSQIQQGSISSHAYVPVSLAKNPSVQAGVRLDGAISQSSTGVTRQGSMVILKVRDKTLQVYTQASSYLSDFNNVVLPSLTFAP